MTRQETEVPSTVISWGPIRFFTWIWSGCQAVAGWFYSNREEYPPDEAGELMRRYMANKSWFDKISSGWNGQFFLLKAVYISLFTLGFGFAGLLLGSSLIWAVSAAIISIITHKLLISHEANRWEGARIFAAESIALNTNLRATQGLFNEATSEMHSTHVALKLDSDAMQEQVVVLDTESQIVQQQNEVLVTVVQDVEMETAALRHQENAVIAEFAAISEDLGAYHQEINDSRDKVETIGEAVSQFSDVVVAMQGSQIRLSEAVDKICFFASARTRVKTPDLEEANDDFIAALMREVEGNDAFIDELTGPHSPGITVH